MLADDHGCGRLGELLATPVAPLAVLVKLGNGGAADLGIRGTAAELRVHADDAGFGAEVRDRLASARVGLRLYLLGTEGFIWRWAAVARGFGLGAEEMQVERCGTLARRVYCVHCGAFTEQARHNIVTCAGCGRSLFVRDHFSRHHAAYMGFQVDAEVPGALPPIEEVYP